MIVSGYSTMENLEVKPALFLDRDGVINIDHGYVFEAEKLQFLEDLGPSLKKLSSKYHLIVITNQSGIARDYFSYEDVEKFHKYLNHKLKSDFGVEINAFYVCPHHPKYSGECDCRKPKTAMLEQANKDFKIDLNSSVMVGDKESDVLCAKNFGIEAIQMDGSYGKSDKADHHVKNWKELESLLSSM